jgi:hypothetical protein
MSRYQVKIGIVSYDILDGDIALNVVKTYPKNIATAVDVVDHCRILNLEDDDYDRYTTQVIEYATDSPAHARSMWNIVMFGYN